MVGVGGGATVRTIASIASAVVSQDLGGMFVWSGSVVDKSTGKTALSYNHQTDAGSWPEADEGRWAKALKSILRGEPTKIGHHAHPPAPPPPRPPGTTCYDLPPPASYPCCRGSCAWAMEMKLCSKQFFVGPGLCNQTCGRCHHVAGGMSVVVDHGRHGDGSTRI